MYNAVVTYIIEFQRHEVLMQDQKSAITYVRLTVEQRRGLQYIAEKSGIGGISDHLRKATDEYIERNKSLIAELDDDQPTPISQY